MNYLAHLYLADPDPDSVVGNLLGDCFKGPLTSDLPPPLRRAVALHRKVDAYSDGHPVFRRSKRRISPRFRRYAGILIDIYYDHFLATRWSHYSSIPLPRFAADVYSVLEARSPTLPPPLRARAAGIVAHDLLLSYRQLAGVAAALAGIERRLRRPSRLGEATTELEANYTALSGDFAHFFPQLIAFGEQCKLDLVELD